MSVLDDLLDDYGALAEAASRLLESKYHHVGEHERCCEASQCLKCDEAYIQAEADRHRALAKVAPPTLRRGAGDDPGNRWGPGTQQAINDVRGSPAEYLRRFFSELERG